MADSLPQRVRRYIEREGLLARGDGVLVGISGGPDSVALLHLLHRLSFDVRAAHANFGLRGRASEEDEAFVRDWCADLGVPLEVRRFDVEAEGEGRSIQAAARALRYDWFAALAAAERCRRVAVGHHRDDQAETVLLQLFRGAGPEGLAGMAPRRRLDPGSDVDLVRPLLEVRRAELEAYLRAEGLAWRTDASNTSPKYRRSVVREQLLPIVERHFGAGAVDRIASAAGLLRGYAEEEVAGPLRALVAALGRACPEGGGTLSLAGLAELPAVWRGRLVLEALRRWLPEVPHSEAVAGEVAALLDAQPGRRAAFPEGVVWRERSVLRFIPRTSRAAEVAAADAHPRSLAPGEEVALGRDVVRLELLGTPPDRLDQGAPRTAYVDADRLVFPLEVRPWRAGDRLQPLGMEQHKLVSDLLTDAGVPSHARAGVLVVCSEGRIVWVAGVRPAHPARVRADTERVAKISILSHESPIDSGG